MNDTELVHVLRGDLPESVHRGVVTLVDHAGTVIEAYGDPAARVWLRSIAKPFQAALVAQLAADCFSLSNQELAIMAGSHGGTPEQVSILRGLLARIGVTEADLRCGMSAPLDRNAAESLRQTGQKPTPLNHPCSGKHSGMLAACQAQGWSIDGYEHFEHPLQQAIHESLAGVFMRPKHEITVALDGCSVPTFGTEVHAVAYAFAQLGARGGDLGRVGQVMCAYPLLMSGHGRMDSTLMQITNGRLIAKDGSEGTFAVSIPDAQAGLVIKISDGATRAIMPVVTALLARHGYITADETRQLEAAYPTIINIHTGERAGELKVVL